MISPLKLGREPVGSPTKIGSVSRPMAVAVFCAAENVSRPMMTNSAPRRLISGFRIRWCSSAWERKVLPPPFQRRSMTSRPGRRSAMKANSRSQKAANGSAGWSATALYWK